MQRIKTFNLCSNNRGVRRPPRLNDDGLITVKGRSIGSQILLGETKTGWGNEPDLENSSGFNGVGDTEGAVTHNNSIREERLLLNVVLSDRYSSDVNMPFRDATAFARGRNVSECRGSSLSQSDSLPRRWVGDEKNSSN